MNKRGDLAITLLVFMALLIIGVALFSFIVHSKINAIIDSGSFVDKVVADKQAIEREVFIKGQSLLIEDYYLKAKNYEVEKSKLGYYVFSINVVDKGIGFESKWDKGDLQFFNKDEIVLMNELLIKERSLFFEGEQQANMNIKYSPKIFVKIRLNDIGLHGFDEIDSALNECKIKDEIVKIKECLSGKLANFDVNVDDLKNVKMSTKSKFYLDKEFKSIELNAKL